MMFVFSIPEDTYRPKKKFKNNFIDTMYPEPDVELGMFKCPNCHEHQLFRGLVYIGCAGCICWFSEKEIIEDNLED